MLSPEARILGEDKTAKVGKLVKNGLRKTRIHLGEVDNSLPPAGWCDEHLMVMSSGYYRRRHNLIMEA
jgi:hypothetical protein